MFHYYFLCIEFKLAAILTAGTSEIDTSLEFDRPENLKPQCHTNTTNWLPWIKMDDDLPRFDGDHG